MKNTHLSAIAVGIATAGISSRELQHKFPLATRDDKTPNELEAIEVGRQLEKVLVELFVEVFQLIANIRKGLINQFTITI